VFVTSTNIALSAASAVTMLGNIFTSLTDPDTSGWEKFTSVLTTLTALIPTLVILYKSLTTLINKETLEKLANAAATVA
jgi:sorbitol-specific phosphotransferase system component IIC